MKSLRIARRPVTRSRLPEVVDTLLQDGTPLPTKTWLTAPHCPSLVIPNGTYYFPRAIEGLLAI